MSASPIAFILTPAKSEQVSLGSIARLFIFGALCGSIGLAAGLKVTRGIAADQVIEASNMLLESNARIKLLTSALKSVSDATLTHGSTLTASLDADTPTTGTVVVATVATPQVLGAPPSTSTLPASSPIRAAPPAPKMTPVKAAEVRVTKVATLPVPMPAIVMAAKPAASPAPLPSPASQTSSLVAPKEAQDRIEAVSAEKAGLKTIASNSVTTRRGEVIKVGEAFSSGERLISVDMGNGVIQTDRRTLVILP